MFANAPFRSVFLSLGSQVLHQYLLTECATYLLMGRFLNYRVKALSSCNYKCVYIYVGIHTQICIYIYIYGASLVAQLVKNPPKCRTLRFDSWVRKIPWRRERLPTPVFLGLPGSSDGKESACNVGDLGSTPGLERSPGGENGNPLQYSCLEKPHGQRGLVGCNPWGGNELDMTERLSTAQHI